MEESADKRQNTTHLHIVDNEDSDERLIRCDVKNLFDYVVVPLLHTELSDEFHGCGKTQQLHKLLHTTTAPYASVSFPPDKKISAPITVSIGRGGGVVAWPETMIRPHYFHGFVTAICKVESPDSIPHSRTATENFRARFSVSRQVHEKRRTPLTGSHAQAIDVT